LEKLLSEGEANFHLKPAVLKKMNPLFADVETRTFGNKVRSVRASIIASKAVEGRHCTCSHSTAFHIH
jgi:hypothetical protein